MYSHAVLLVGHMPCFALSAVLSAVQSVGLTGAYTRLMSRCTVVDTANMPQEQQGGGPPQPPAQQVGRVRKLQ